MSEHMLQPHLSFDLAYSMDTTPLGGSALARQELRTVIEYGPDLVRYAVVHHTNARDLLDEWRRGNYQREPGRLLSFQDRG